MRVNDISVNLYRGMNSLMKTSYTSQSRTKQQVNVIDAMKFEKLRAGVIMSSAYQKNIQDGMTAIQTMRASLASAGELSDKLKELSVEYQNETLSDSEREQIKKDGKKIMESIQSIFENAEFNGKPLFKESHYNILIGNKEVYKINTPDLSSISKLKTLQKSNEMPSEIKNISLTEIQSLRTSPAQLMSLMISNDDNEVQNKAIELNMPRLMKAQKSTFTESIKAVSNEIPVYTIKEAKYDIPNQNNFTGYKKIYNDNNQLIYEGHLKNGKFDGFGVLYDDSGKKVYEGAWSEGGYDGFGTLYYSNGNIQYEGDIDKGKLTGWGSYRKEDGSTIYTGNLVNGYREGWGTTNLPNGQESRFYEDYSRYGNDNDNSSGEGNGNGNGGIGEDNGNGNGGNDNGTGNGGENGNGSETGNGSGGNNNEKPSIEVPDYLDKDFIEENIDNVISNADRALDVQEFILESRLRYQATVQSIFEDREQRMLTDEIVKTLKEEARQSMLESVNQSLMMHKFESDRQLIAKLLG